VPLTRIGLPKIWDGDLEKRWLWQRHLVEPVTMWLAPSYAYGAGRVPAAGGAVLAANHLSAIDPPLIGTMSPRAIHYMTKAELLRTPIVGEALSLAGGFPVRRGEADRDALRRARELVRRGEIVGIFMEGTRQRFGHPGEVHAGAPMIALQEDVPIVPCGVYSFGWTRRNRSPCAVVWGEPMRLEGLARSGRGYKEGAQLVAAELVKLWRQAGEAVTAGFPAELPDGARRSDPHAVPEARAFRRLSQELR
jgi:1-acyl-sn-glycerol-3-phosphate acyltransferase